MGREGSSRLVKCSRQSPVVVDPSRVGPFKTKSVIFRRRSREILGKKCGGRGGRG